MQVERQELKHRRHEAFLQMCREEFHRTRGEEWSNGLSHLAGVVFGIVALVLMLVAAARRGTAWHVVSCSIYGATLILLSFSSTMYHLLTNFRAKRVFQILDHCTIYLLIAGTYTPFALVTMGHDAMGWSVFGVEWGLALCGVVIESVFPKIVKYASLPIYLVMGWLLVIDMKEVAANLPTPGMALLIAGGLSFSAGVAFYVMDHTPYMHTVWHVFVLGGIVCHWCCIMFSVIPRG